MRIQPLHSTVMKGLLQTVLIICLLLLPLKASDWGPFRGMNASPHLLQEKDVADFASLGGNLLRLSFPSTPLINIQTHEFDETAFGHLERVVTHCEKYGIRVVIDPHYYPGMKMQWTMLGYDEFWKNFLYHDLVIGLWEEIAKRYQNRGDVIAGYDLLNEPTFDPPTQAKEGTPCDLNLLYSKLVSAIRKHDASHTIILAAPNYYEDGVQHGYGEGIRLLDPVADKNVVYEIHMYSPSAFTHQGVYDPSDPFVEYPGLIAGEKWDQSRLDREFRTTVEFARENGVSIFVGEFSSTRWLGEAGNRYLRDVIELCERYGFSWAYHSFREFHGWDAEMSNSDRLDLKRYPATPRLDMLKRYFSLNGSRLKYFPQVGDGQSGGVKFQTEFLLLNTGDAATFIWEYFAGEPIEQRLREMSGSVSVSGPGAFALTLRQSLPAGVPGVLPTLTVFPVVSGSASRE